MKSEERLIVALDIDSLNEALRLADSLAPHVGRFKVGFELFVRSGWEGVRQVAERAPVLLDLKLHDIPATVVRTLRIIGELNVDMVTLHSSGGSTMMREACAVVPHLRLLAVTVLTSLSEKDLRVLGIDRDLKTVAGQRALLAVADGCAGVVASPQEALLIRRLLGPQPIIVTPGVRPAGSAQGDQRRTATPRAAIAAGADFVVVGRPIRDAPNPLAAAKAIVDDIACGLSYRQDWLSK